MRRVHSEWIALEHVESVKHETRPSKPEPPTIRATLNPMHAAPLSWHPDAEACQCDMLLVSCCCVCTGHDGL